MCYWINLNVQHSITESIYLNLHSRAEISRMDEAWFHSICWTMVDYMRSGYITPFSQRHLISSISNTWGSLPGPCWVITLPAGWQLSLPLTWCPVARELQVLCIGLCWAGHKRAQELEGLPGTYMLHRLEKWAAGQKPPCTTAKPFFLLLPEL